MGLYIILFLFMVLLLFWLILTQPAKKSAAFLTNMGPIILLTTGALLTLFRRGVVGMPLIFLGLSWWRRNRSTRPVDHPGGQKSTVRSTYFEMELDHDTGEIDGKVLAGHQQGARLSAMKKADLFMLYQEICSDTDSASLLASFLDRYHPDWRDDVDPDSASQDHSSSGFKNMTKQEAYQILGLEPGATREEIHQAWRRLIKGVHPDHGGSAFLTAKINAAKDVLLD
jgi:hypothetical protein